MPGETYSIVIGVGGTGGSAGSGGTNGGDTQFTDGTNVLTYAGGGQAGSATPTPVASGGQANPNAMISHPGFPALALSSGGVSQSVPGPPYAENLLPNSRGYSLSTQLGSGGLGVCGANGPLAGQTGGIGYVLLSW